MSSIQPKGYVRLNIGLPDSFHSASQTYVLGMSRLVWLSYRVLRESAASAMASMASVSINNMKSAILVAGGAGYIGTHTVKELRREGYQAVVLDNHSTSQPRQWLDDVTFIKGDIGNRALVRETVERYDIRAVILFAGHAYVGESTGNPHKYYRNNLAQGIEFIGALLEAGVQQLVFSSSCSIYGTQDVETISEQTPKSPLSPYAQTKWMMEQMLEWYGRGHGLRSMSLRYFNAAGADLDGELGEDHDPETHLIPLAILAALGGDQLRVFGNDYPTADGTAIRDYIHVADLARGHVAALRYLAAGGATGAVNLGTGNGTSILEVIREVELVTGRKVPYKLEPRREGDAARLVAAPGAARTLLGWEPHYSDLNTIVRTAAAWFIRKRTLPAD